jgi:undecaprenyl-diphosphatase
MTSEHRADRAGKALLEIDHRVHEAVKDGQSSKAIRFISKLSDAGDQPQLRLLCAGMIVIGAVRKDTRMVLAGARMLLAHELATVAKAAIKDRVDRTRPRSADDKDQERPEPGNDKGKEESSFPSGHSAGAMAVGSAYAAAYPAHATPALLAAGAIAAAQIPRCAHYPTDVGAGLAIGAAANGIVGLSWRLLRSITRMAIRRG